MTEHDDTAEGGQVSESGGAAGAEPDPAEGGADAGPQKTSTEPNAQDPQGASEGEGATEDDGDPASHDG